LNNSLKSFSFHYRKDDSKDVPPTTIEYYQNTGQVNQRKGKGKKWENDATIYQKIDPLKALVDQEGWKVSLLKGMYVAQLLALIQVIWLKGSRLTYVTEKWMNLMVLAEQEFK